MSTIIDVVTASRELEGESPAEILRWASKHIGSKLTFATGFGAEGCVIIDLIARHDLPIDLFTLEQDVPTRLQGLMQIEKRRDQLSVVVSVGSEIGNSINPERPRQYREGRLGQIKTAIAPALATCHAS